MAEKYGSRDITPSFELNQLVVFLDVLANLQVGARDWLEDLIGIQVVFVHALNGTLIRVGKEAAETTGDASDVMIESYRMKAGTGDPLSGRLVPATG